MCQQVQGVAAGTKLAMTAAATAASSNQGLLSVAGVPTAGRPKRRHAAGSGGTDDRFKALERAHAESTARADFHEGLSDEQRSQWTTVAGAGEERGVKVWVGECSD